MTKDDQKYPENQCDAKHCPNELARDISDSDDLLRSIGRDAQYGNGPIPNQPTGHTRDTKNYSLTERDELSATV